MTPASQSTTPVLAQQPERSVPALETERLVLRAPHRGTSKPWCVSSATAASRKIPRAFRIPMASTTLNDFLAAINRQDGEATSPSPMAAT